MKNKNLIAILILIFIVAVVRMPDLYGQESAENIGGELTPDITWRIENNILYLSGNGVVPTTMYGAKSAWFNYKSQFHSVVIEDGITGVGQNIFIGYKNLRSLTIAGTVKDIPTNAFNTCTSLSLIELRGAIPPDINITTFYKLKFNNVKLIVPSGTKATYKDDPFWGQFINVEESTFQVAANPATPELLEAPCTIRLTRTTNFVGGGVKLNVFLNGSEMEKLGNGQTIEMRTDRAKNMLFIKQGKRPVTVRRFDATAGSNVNIEFSYFLGNMKIIEDGKEE